METCLAGSCWWSPGIPPAPHTRSPAVPTFLGTPQFSKYVPRKNKISGSDALRSPVPAVHNSFIVSVAHYSHIPPTELSISSPAKLESESWEHSKTVVVWVCHLPFFFPPHFLDCLLFLPPCKKCYIRFVLASISRLERATGVTPDFLI